MLVLRIESKSKRGPYIHSREGAFRAHDQGDCRINMATHPVPQEDQMLAGPWEEILDGIHPKISAMRDRFGFATVDQYHRWFYTEKARSILSEEGYHISFYAVPDDRVVVGCAQVVFDVGAAEMLITMPCTAPAAELQTLYASLENRPPEPPRTPAWEEYDDIDF